LQTKTFSVAIEILPVLCLADTFLLADYFRVVDQQPECLEVNILISRDVVLGLGPWSWVVLKEKITVLGPDLGLEHSVLGPGLGLEPSVLGPGLGLEGLVLGPVLGLETTVQSIALNYIHQCHWLSCSL